MGGWQITRKDLRLLLRDRRALVLLIALPLIFIAILGFSSGRLLGLGDNPQRNNRQLRIQIVDQDQSPLAREVVESLRAREGIAVAEVSTLAEAEQHLEQGTAEATLAIGPHFYERFDELRLGDILNPAQGQLREGPASLDMQILYKPTLSNTGPMIRELLFSQTLQTLVPHVARKNRFAARFVDRAGENPDEWPADEESPDETSSGELLSGETVEGSAADGLDEEATSPTPVATVALPETADDRPSEKDNLVYQQIVPSYTVLFVFFLINLMARSFITERDLGTLRRLRAAPIGSQAILAGKTLPFLLISLLQSMALFLFGRLLFGMSWGVEPWLLLPVIACTSLSATALGLLVATIVRTESQVSAYANFLVIVLGGISGCFLPRTWMPEIMQQVSLATPHAWALIAYDQLLNSARIDYFLVAQCCAMLLVFAGACFAVGWWRFRTLD